MKRLLVALKKNVKGRKTIIQALVVIAVVVQEKNLGRIRFRIIPDASGESLIPLIKENIAPDRVVTTDGWFGYATSKKENYVHVV